jgi:hypothetical protein
MIITRALNPAYVLFWTSVPEKKAKGSRGSGRIDIRSLENN